METLKYNYFQDYGLPEKTTDKFEYLNQKLDAVSRKVTEWDLYKISTTVTDSLALSSTINALLPGTSLLLDTESFIFQGEKYRRGDLVFKDFDSKIQHIEVERGGLFAPSKLEYIDDATHNNKKFILSFKYLSAVPQNDEASVGPTPSEGQNKTWIVNQDARQINFEDMPMPEEKGALYAEVWRPTPQNNSYNITVKTIGDPAQLVYPAVYCFSANGERVFAPYSITSATTDSVTTLTYKTMPAIVDKVVFK